MSIFYVASPYSSPDATTRHQRFIAACRAAAHLMLSGHTVFCPIAHSHPIAEVMNGRHLDHEFWMRQDLPLLDLCDRLIVLKLDGWEKSRGVAEEIRYAQDRCIGIEYMEPVAIPARGES